MSLAVCPFCAAPMAIPGSTTGYAPQNCCPRGRHLEGQRADIRAGRHPMDKHPFGFPPSRSPAPFPAAAMRWDWEPS